LRDLLAGRDASRQPFFSRTIVTGSHAASLRAVSSGAADLAAIDDTVWSWMQVRGRPDGLRVIDQTRDWPAPPLVFSARLAPEHADRLESRLLELRPTRVPGLHGFRPARASDYARMLEIAESGEDLLRTTARPR